MIIVVHGGAAKVGVKFVEGKLVGIKRAARAGYEMLAEGKTALDAVEAAVRYMETDPNFNCGIHWFLSDLLTEVFT